MVLKTIGKIVKADMRAIYFEEEKQHIECIENVGLCSGKEK